MADSASQPTILVKKADGTTERVTLVELKNRQQAKSVPTKQVDAPKPIVPVTQPKPIPAVKSIPMRQEDTSSLLQEDIPVAPLADTKISPTRTNQVDEIIKKLSFKVNPNLENRLRSSIQLRLKDIRGEEETKYLILQAPKDGGLGLSPMQAEEVLRFTVIPARLPDGQVKEVIQDTGSIVDKIIGSSPAKDTSIEDLLRPKNNLVQQVNLVQPLKNTAPLAVGSSLSDVHHVAPKEMSKVDELKYFTLTDFRRLAGKPSEAASRLKQKFVNLQLESFVLFLEGLEAWKQSPFFNDCVNELESALRTKRKLSAILGEKNKINMEEIGALLKMEKELKY